MADQGFVVVSVTIQGAEVLEGLNAAHATHADVEKDEVRRQAFYLLLRFFNVSRFCYYINVRKSSQHLNQFFAGQALVVYHYCFHGVHF